MHQTIVSVTETSSKLTSTLCQKIVKDFFFWSKLSKFRVVRTVRYCSNFTSTSYKYFLRNVWNDFIIINGNQGLETSGRNRFHPGRMAETGKKVFLPVSKLEEIHVVYCTCKQSVGKKFPDTVK